MHLTLRKKAGVNRMPVWISWISDPIRAHWLTLLLLVDVCYGGYNMFDAGVAFWCGLVLTVSGGLIALGWNVTGAGLGLFAWAALMFAGTDSPILLGAMAGFSILVIYDVVTGLDADREAKQKRP